jgi:Protein of unknown function (DUF2934)
MNTKPRQAKKPGSNAKSNPATVAAASPDNPAKPQKAPPTQARVAQLAYEIWILTGKQPGRDQQNWFEAEWQLRQM